MKQISLFGDCQPIFTKEELIKKLIEIRDMGWIENARPGNSGGVGNTLEDLLGIKENNLPIPNAAEWELKSQRSNTSSLTTLFHMDPSPTGLTIVNHFLIPNYGWKHKEAGKKYSASEMSFRQTINCLSRSDRGFKPIVNRKEEKVEVSFDASAVSPRHSEWLNDVSKKVGLGELDPQPYWGFDDLFHKAGTKLHNCFYVQADVKKVKGVEFLHYNKIFKLTKFNLYGFLDVLEEGSIYIDFDARTGHDHGTKFRLRQNKFTMLYGHVEEIY